MLPFGLGQEVKFEKNLGPKLSKIEINKLLDVKENKFINKLDQVYKAIEKVNGEISKALTGFSSDDQKKYRSQEQLEEDLKKDPIELFSKLLIKKGVLTELAYAEFKKEILPVLNRRMVIPFYLPVISLICALLLVKSQKIYLNKISIFIYSFSILIFTELALRYTGINLAMLIIYISLPFIFFIFLYFILILSFSRENKNI